MMPPHSMGVGMMHHPGMGQPVFPPMMGYPGMGPDPGSIPGTGHLYCSICKVNNETNEQLEEHMQTEEHQLAEVVKLSSSSLYSFT